jgi:hypothetical protein
MGCTLATARLRFHVDVNVGDPVWPTPGLVEIPRLLGDVITVTGYPLSMVLAEKIVTALQRGTVNTRWRDFADIYLLTGRQEVDGTELTQSVRVVAEHRSVKERAGGERVSQSIEDVADVAAYDEAKSADDGTRVSMTDLLVEVGNVIDAKVKAEVAAQLDER